MRSSQIRERHSFAMQQKANRLKAPQVIKKVNNPGLNSFRYNSTNMSFINKYDPQFTPALQQLSAPDEYQHLKRRNLLTINQHEEKRNEDNEIFKIENLDKAEKDNCGQWNSKLGINNYVKYDNEMKRKNENNEKKKLDVVSKRPQHNTFVQNIDVQKSSEKKRKSFPEAGQRIDLKLEKGGKSSSDDDDDSPNTLSPQNEEKSASITGKSYSSLSSLSLAESSERMENEIENLTSTKKDNKNEKKKMSSVRKVSFSMKELQLNDSENMRQFLMSPTPRNAGTIQCYIKRDRKKSKLFPEYR